MATSPTTSQSLYGPASKKRPSISSQASLSGPASKRAKLHPLRQTSFPVTTGDVTTYTGTPARSDNGSVVESSFSALSKPQTKKRRPRKSVQVADGESTIIKDEQSQVSGRGKGAKSIISTRSGGADEPASDEEEEIIDIEDDNRDENAQRDEDNRLNRFVNALTPAQSKRWYTYRAQKFNKNIVRKLVNQTVAQSVGANVVDAMLYSTKAFALEIVERARDVQVEYAKAYEQTRELEKQERLNKLRQKEAEFAQKQSNTSEPDPKTNEMDRRRLMKEITKLRTASEDYTPNKHAAGLLPDHIREALRRYKADGEGGGLGFEGLSHPLLGIRGSTIWKMGDGVTGARLFN